MRLIGIAAAVFSLMLAATVATAAAITLNPTYDAYIFERGADSTMNNDWLSVRPHDTTHNWDEHDSVMTFDLTGVTEPITSAYMMLYAMDYVANTAYGVSQSASLVDPNNISHITYNKVYGESPSFTTTSLDTLGDIDVAEGSGKKSTWYYSSAASAVDLSTLESLRTTTGAMSLLLKANSGYREWSDTEQGWAPRLVINGGAPPQTPEPSVVVLLVTGLLGFACHAWRKRR
jgi:hypothetical protein